MYVKLFAIPCYDGSGTFMDGFWRFERNTGQTKNVDWVEFTGLRTENESDMTNMRRILTEKKQILTDWQRHSYQKMHDSRVSKAMRHARKLVTWESGLHTASL